MNLSDDPNGNRISKDRPTRHLQDLLAGFSNSELKQELARREVAAQVAKSAPLKLWPVDISNNPNGY